jgi:AcrR family transcriptional regulator
MGTLTRKQREVHQRELLLLDVARKMLIEKGYAGLSMDRLAEATEYSKGTVYQHFSTKEDLVSALALQSIEQRALYFSKAAGYQGHSRERFTAIGVADELFARLHPHYFRSELIIKMADLEDRASAERLDAIKGLECRCMGSVLAIIDEAVAAEDLVLPNPTTPGDVAFAVFTLAVGTQSTLLNFKPLLQDMGISSPLLSFRENCQVLVDGFGWKPLRSEWDYAGTFRRISREVFADEWQRAGLG